MNSKALENLILMPMTLADKLPPHLRKSDWSLDKNFNTETGKCVLVVDSCIFMHHLPFLQYVFYMILRGKLFVGFIKMLLRLNFVNINFFTQNSWMSTAVHR